MSVLVTGAAGFVGFHVAQALAARGERVFGVDSLDDSPASAAAALKTARLALLQRRPEFEFGRADLADPGALGRAARAWEIGKVVHLAGRAGVRVADLAGGVRANLETQARVLEFCRDREVSHLVHASSSAVYGARGTARRDGGGDAGDPLSAYGASKRGGELLARACTMQGGPPVTTLRYFTMYGPWSRPDTAVWIFTEAILAGRPVRLHGHGRMRRSFTYVDDAVSATLAALDRPPEADAAGFRHAIYDILHPSETGLESFVTILEDALGQRAVRERVPAAGGEVMADAGDTEAARRALGFVAQVGIEEGLARFVAWYLGDTRPRMAGAGGAGPA